jgi:energy-coupling factor transporter ATP-binding protein EcfA2
MVELGRVSYAYPGSATPALRDIDLSVGDGECVLLAGPSGCGKSTLLYLLNGLIPHVLGGDLSGEVLIEGARPAETPIQEISRRVGTVFQNPEVQLFMPRVSEDVAFGCENLCLAPDETQRRVEVALARLSLTSLHRREVAKLSGGQKQRVAIAGMLAMGCRTLLLDEPTSDLDDDGRAELLSVLHDLRRASHTIVMAEHRLDHLDGLADRCVCMEAGRIVSDGPFPPPSPITRRLNGRPPRTTAPLVELEDAGCSYPPGDPALEDVSLALYPGEVTALLGPNGSGKTTLLKLLCGRLAPTRGRVMIGGTANPRLDQLVGKVGFLFQNPDEQLFTDSAIGEIAFGPGNLGRSVDPRERLEQVGLGSHADSHPAALSRGERQRLAAAAVLAMEPEIILLDEPTTGLDRNAWIQLMELVIGHATERGAGVVYSTHHQEMADAFAHRAITLREGRIVDDRVL